MTWRTAIALGFLSLASLSFATRAADINQDTSSFAIIELRDGQDPEQRVLGGCFQITSIDNAASKWLVCDNVQADAVKNQAIGDMTNREPLNDSNSQAGTIWAEIGTPLSPIRTVELRPPLGRDGYVACRAAEGECTADGIETIVGTAVYLSYDQTAQSPARSTDNETLTEIPSSSDIAELSESIDELKARVAELEAQQLIAGTSAPADSSVTSPFPEPLVIGTEITIESYPYGMYVPPNSNVDAKLFTLACSIQLPNEDDELRAQMYGYGQAVAWLTCGWLPGAYS